MAGYFPEACLFFPAGEQPEFMWRAEAEEAAKVLCPLHGRRFQTVVTRHLYYAQRFYEADFEHGWPHRSAQYQKAMRRASILRCGRRRKCDLPGLKKLKS